MLPTLLLACLSSNDKPSDPSPFIVFDALKAQNATCTETKPREIWSGETGGYPSYITNIYECKNLGIAAGDGLVLDHFILIAEEQYTYRHLAINRETSHRYTFKAGYDFISTDNPSGAFSVNQIHFSTAFAGQTGFSDSPRNAAKKLHWHASLEGAPSPETEKEEQALQQAFSALGLAVEAPQEEK